MTPDQLREHVGEFIVCSSRFCSLRNRQTILGKLVLHRGEPVLDHRARVFERNGVWELRRESRPKTPARFTVERHPEIPGVVSGWGDEPETDGAEASYHTVIPLSARVRCPNCGRIKRLAEIERNELTRLEAKR